MCRTNPNSPRERRQRLEAPRGHQIEPGRSGRVVKRVGPIEFGRGELVQPPREQQSGLEGELLRHGHLVVVAAVVAVMVVVVVVVVMVGLKLAAVATVKLGRGRGGGGGGLQAGEWRRCVTTWRSA